MDLILAYGAGLLTLINPCVLPVLPIVLATALQASPLGPLVLAAGMSLAFVSLGLFVSTIGYALGLDDIVVSRGAAVLMIVFGLALLIPRVGERLALATSGMASSADARLDRVDRSGLRGQFLGGLLLGAVWSPCIGPTLGAAIALASQGENLIWAGLIMAFFALGVSSIIVGLGYGTRAIILKRQSMLRAIAGRARPAMGAVFVGVGLIIFFDIQQLIEAWAVGALPIWLQDLSVSI